MAKLDSPPSVGDPFSIPAVYAYWKEFDLDGRRSKLDEIGLKIADLQEQSTAHRKQLADATREFKRSTNTSPAAECAAAAGHLLKQYQEEIDTLTRRAKHGESAFLDLYEQLFEAPDPAQALAVAMDNEVQLSQLTTQVHKISSELAEYKAESKAIKNQDLTIRKQEETIRELTAALEAKGAEMEASRKQAAAEADAAVLERMQAREAELSEMLTSAQSSLEAMKRLYAAAQNQLFELQSRREEVAVGRQEEVDLAAAELEAVQTRLLALEAEKGNLQAKLSASRQEAAAAAAGGGYGTSGSSNVEETLRQELNSQRDVSARLRQDLAEARQALHSTVAEWEDKYAAVQEQLEQQVAAAEQLQRELQLRPTTAQLGELQQQVRALQAVGYGSVEDLPAAAGPAAGGASPVAAAARGTAAGGLNLEGMLLAKNRKLEHDATMTKLAFAEASQELESAKEQISDLQDQLQQKVELISRLEEDLMAVRQGSAALVAGISSTAASAAALTSSSSFPGKTAEGLRPATAGAYEDDGSENNPVVRVLAGQRDRLRQRVQELEVQLSSMKSELQHALHDLSAARADNVALVERLRYVGGYRQQAAAARSNAAGKGGDVEAGPTTDVVGKYSQLYDEGINPFKEFQGQQREQKRRQMSVADKAMYSVGSLVYQSSTARLLTFGYLVLLHLLVFGSLTHMTHRTSGHIMDHHELLLQHGRHDLTRLMHHDGGSTAVAAAAAAAVANATAAAAQAAGGAGHPGQAGV